MCAVGALHVTMKSQRLSHMTNISGFTTLSVNPITTKLGRMADQHTEVSANK